jgi:hypothetical protein
VFTRIAAFARTLFVPSAEALERMSDLEACELFGSTRRERARAAIWAEMARRDAEAERQRREEDRRKRARAKRAAEREAYDLYVYNAWIAAEEACNGYLLSKAGLEAGVEPDDLWPMQEARAMRLASEELREWWAANGRMTFAEWKRQSREQRPEMAVAA